MSSRRRVNNSQERQSQRRAGASERQAARDKLTDAQQLASLDATFGKGKGARKERARLSKES